jgi:glucose-6-phosphate-specific signal transduction histidine kinase
VYGFQFDWFYWTLVAATVAGAVLLAVRSRAWRDRRALRTLLIIVPGSIVAGTALVLAVSFYCARLYSSSPLTFDIVSSAVILACLTQIARSHLRRR